MCRRLASGSKLQLSHCISLNTRQWNSLGQFAKSISLNFIFSLESFRSLQRTRLSLFFNFNFFLTKSRQHFLQKNLFYFSPSPPHILPRFSLPLHVNGEMAYDFPRSFFRHIFKLCIVFLSRFQILVFFSSSASERKLWNVRA